MQQTRWAMVGSGLMLELIGHDFALTENIAPAVLVSRTRERAAAAAAEYGFAEGSDDFEAVLQRDDIDVVYIATPHTLHFPMAMAALEAGKHVLVEKSMTTSAARTRELCAFAEAQGLFAMEAMWSAFHPVVRDIRARIDAGAIGELRLMQADFSVAAPYRPDWRLWAKELAGGTTLDQGVYPLSFARMMLGEPASMDVHVTNEHGVDAETVITLEFDGGRRAVLVNGLRAFSPQRAYFGGTAGYIETHDSFWHPSGFTIGKATPTSYERAEHTLPVEGGGYVHMLRAVSQAVLDGRTEHPLRTHAESIAVAEMMDVVLRQAAVTAEAP